MNDAVALHCWGCGRELGLEPVAEAGTLPCPRCGEHLSTLGDAHSGIHDCDACGGQFIEHEMLRAMLENRTPYTFAQKARTARAALGEPVRYLPCPSCRSLMNRKNFGGESGVVVDVCARHGTFFDVGELPLVLAFVEAGGLERAQQRADEARRRAVREQATERSALMGELEADPGPSTLDLVGEFIHFLESLVVRRR
jgi:Zn-finger nucleic acid-binding protein